MPGQVSGCRFQPLCGALMGLMIGGLRGLQVEVLHGAHAIGRPASQSYSLRRAVHTYTALNLGSAPISSAHTTPCTTTACSKPPGWVPNGNFVNLDSGSLQCLGQVVVYFLEMLSFMSDLRIRFCNQVASVCVRADDKKCNHDDDNDIQLLLKRVPFPYPLPSLASNKFRIADYADTSTTSLNSIHYFTQLSSSS